MLNNTPGRIKISDFIDWGRGILLSVLCPPLHWLQGGVFALLQTMNFRDPRTRLQELTDRQVSVIRCRVMCRWKNRLTKASTPRDFLLWSQPDLTSLDSVLKLDVSLYCISSDLVLFVRTSPGVACYCSDTSPFFYLAQFLHAEEAYVTSHHWLQVLASEIANHCRVPVTVLSSTGRCGSTMVSQIMEGVPGTVGISEPDALLNLVLLAKPHLKPDRYLLLLRSTILMIIYHAKAQTPFLPSQKRVDHIFIKTRSECSVLIRDIHRVCPDIRHVFMYRRLPSLLQSVKQLLSGLKMPWLTLVSSDTVAALTPCFRLSILRQTFFGTVQERELLTELVPELSYIGIFAAVICSQLKMVRQLQTEGFPIPALLYEDVLADTVGTVGSLFEYLQLPRRHLDTALGSMSIRSQRNVPGFEGKGTPSTYRLTAREQRQVDRILSTLQLPTIGGDMEFLSALNFGPKQM